MTAGSDWSEQRVASLTKLWADGLTASQIAAELGGFPNCADNGRSAVIGKIHRLGLSGRAKKTSSGKDKSDRRAQGGKVRRINYNRSGSAGLPGPEYNFGASANELEIPLEQRKTLLQLTSKTCKWPVGDPASPEFFFCGAITEVEPYCIYHTRAAHDRSGE